MFGDLALSVPVSTSPDSSDDTHLPPPQMIVQPGYGAFCATDSDGAPCNPRPHVSGVAVFGRHDLNAEFQRADLRRFIDERAPQSHEERLQAAAEWMVTADARADAEGPHGYEYSVTYFDLNRYALGHGPPVPAAWFNGPRDRRFAFDAGGTGFALGCGEPQLD
jgi:hypothetical protein